MGPSQQSGLRVTIVGATGLYKGGLFNSPDPFALVAIDGERTCKTKVVENTITPRWNESFIFRADSQRVLTIRVFDQKKFGKNNGQDFLGVVKLQIGSVIDLSVSGVKTVTRNLQISKKGGDLVAHGQLTVVLSTIMFAQANQLPPNAIVLPPPRSEAYLGTLNGTSTVPSFHERQVSPQPSIENPVFVPQNFNDGHLTSPKIKQRGNRENCN